MCIWFTNGLSITLTLFPFPLLFPFSFKNKFTMSCHRLAETPGAPAILMVKGAPERVIGRCSTMRLKVRGRREGKRRVYNGAVCCGVKRCCVVMRVVVSCGLLQPPTARELTRLLLSSLFVPPYHSPQGRGGRVHR